MAQRLGRPVIDCDNPGTRAAVRNDPARFVESDSLVFIDEDQPQRTTSSSSKSYSSSSDCLPGAPPWARASPHPKMHLVDSGVMAGLLNLTPQKIAQADPATLADYGHLLETFAVGQILKQAGWSDAPVTAEHFRTAAGDEVDLVLERDDGQVIAFEVKSGSLVQGDDLGGMRFLKERLGSRLEVAIVFYTGTHAYTQDGWINVLPLDRLWT